MTQILCPKCGSAATRIEQSQTGDLILGCRCGYCKVMATVVEDGIQVGSLQIEESITLPRQGSKLMACLGALATLGEGTTAKVGQSLSRSGGDWRVDEVASFLTVLKHRGLVRVIRQGKGVIGGSLWTLTAEASKMMEEGSC